MKSTKTSGNTNPAITDTSSDNNAGLGSSVALAAVATQIPWGFLIKAGVIATATVVIIYKITHSFERKSEDSDYHPASISKDQAESRATAIYAAMKGLGNGFEIVRANLTGLNYNGYIRLYNAFGNRKGAVSPPFSSGENLEEWFASQFNENELNELRVIANFF